MTAPATPATAPASDLIDRIAREAGLHDALGDGGNWQSQSCQSITRDDLSRFAALLAEECAKMCDRGAAHISPYDQSATVRQRFGAQVSMEASAEAKRCAATIRAKFAA